MADEQTNVHLTSGEKIRVEGSIPELQGKLTGDLWAVLDDVRGDQVAVRTDQVTHLTVAASGRASFA